MVLTAWIGFWLFILIFMASPKEVKENQEKVAAEEMAWKEKQAKAKQFYENQAARLNKKRPVVQQIRQEHLTETDRKDLDDLIATFEK